MFFYGIMVRSTGGIKDEFYEKGIIKSYNSDSRRILEELFVRLSYIAVKGESVDKT